MKTVYLKISAISAKTNILLDGAITTEVKARFSSNFSSTKIKTRSD